MAADHMCFQDRCSTPPLLRRLPMLLLLLLLLLPWLAAALVPLPRWRPLPSPSPLRLPSSPNMPGSVACTSASTPDSGDMIMTLTRSYWNDDSMTVPVMSMTPIISCVDAYSWFCTVVSSHTTSSGLPSLLLVLLALLVVLLVVLLVILLPLPVVLLAPRASACLE